MSLDSFLKNLLQEKQTGESATLVTVVVVDNAALLPARRMIRQRPETRAPGSSSFEAPHPVTSDPCLVRSSTKRKSTREAMVDIHKSSSVDTFLPMPTRRGSALGDSSYTLRARDVVGARPLSSSCCWRLENASWEDLARPVRARKHCSTSTNTRIQNSLLIKPGCLATALVPGGRGLKNASRRDASEDVPVAPQRRDSP